ncbi:hypothetical protein ACWD4J_29145 [Streptomyces sp. NPDC002577]
MTFCLTPRLIIWIAKLLGALLSGDLEVCVSVMPFSGRPPARMVRHLPDAAHRRGRHLLEDLRQVRKSCAHPHVRSLTQQGLDGAWLPARIALARL